MVDFGLSKHQLRTTTATNIVSKHIMMKQLLLFLFTLGSVASALAGQPFGFAQEAKPFVHPGLMHSRAELEYIKEKIESGEEPWKSAWEELKSARRSKRRYRRRRLKTVVTPRLPVSSLEYKPSPLANVVRGA